MGCEERRVSGDRATPGMHVDDFEIAPPVSMSASNDPVEPLGRTFTTASGGREREMLIVKLAKIR